MPPLAIVSNLFSGDGLVVFLILLLLFGAKKAPDLAQYFKSILSRQAEDEEAWLTFLLNLSLAAFLFFAVIRLIELS